jgi:hypothetical protein
MTLPDMRDELNDSQGLQRYAAEWDERDAQIRGARDSGETTVSVRFVRSEGGLLEASRDAGSWVNECMSAYYGVDSIIAAPPGAAR